MTVFFGTFDRQRPTRTQRRFADIIDISRAVKKATGISLKDLDKIVLVDIIQMSFNRSEKTMWEDYNKVYRKAGRSWRENETVMFVNSSGTMAIFIMAVSRINNAVVLDTRKWRLMSRDGRGSPGEHWFSMDNIQYYAAQVGFHLDVPSDAQVADYLKYMKHPRRKVAYA